MDQDSAPLLAAFAAARPDKLIAFGAPGHHAGRAMPSDLAALVGAKAFAADVMSPKGLDDRTESTHAIQVAHETAAKAWGADLARYVTGGSTQSLHIGLSAVAKPGEAVILARNAHKAEWSATLFAGYRPVPLPVEIDPEWDVEHGVSPDTLAAVIAANPDARAVVVVSPTYFGITSNIVALARVAHAAGLPLIVDAAWGGAFPFSTRLPANPLAQGADVMVCSLHKTMGALAQGSVLLARGQVVDQERLALAYELFETTSPSVAILASMDATRRDHAVKGEKLWGDLLDLADEARADLATIEGVRVLGRERLGGDAAYDLDPSKILLDISAWRVAGYAVDDWLFGQEKLSLGLSDARHLLAIVGLGTARDDLKKLAKGLRRLQAKLVADPSLLPRVPAGIPPLSALDMDLAMPGPDALFADVEKALFEKAEGRIAAETMAPAPPGVPRLVPGQRIGAAHVEWLVKNRDAGMFLLDPSDPSERCIRVVKP
jgi:arginine/lysine/ornithine decarboxylase